MIFKLNIEKLPYEFYSSRNFMLFSRDKLILQVRFIQVLCSSFIIACYQYFEPFPFKLS